MVDRNTDIDLDRGYPRRNDRALLGRRGRRKPLPREQVDGISREDAVRYTWDSTFVLYYFHLYYCYHPLMRGGIVQQKSSYPLPS